MRPRLCARTPAIIAAGVDLLDKRIGSYGTSQKFEGIFGYFREPRNSDGYTDSLTL